MVRDCSDTFDSHQNSYTERQKNAARFPVFSLKNQECPFPLTGVKEVIALTDLTSVPYMPYEILEADIDTKVLEQAGNAVDPRSRFALVPAEVRKSCQNLLDYFAPRTTRNVIENLFRPAVPEVTLLTAHSEMLNNSKHL